MALQRTANHILWDEEHGTHYFRVGSTVYLLECHAICRASQFIKDLLRVPQPRTSGPIIGSGEDVPIHIENVEEPEFDIFAQLAYSGFYDLPSNADVVPMIRKLLHLGEYLMSPTTLKFTFKEVDANLYRFSATELIGFCRQYRTRRFAEKAFHRLVEEPLSSLLLADAGPLGLAGILIIAKTRENMHLHLHNIACNPPNLEHANTFPNITNCNDDWIAAWWNVMARSLMDAENPLGWGEAVRRFRRADFGRMGPQCLDDIMGRVASEMAFFRGREIREDATAKFLELIPEIDLDVD